MSSRARLMAFLPSPLRVVCAWPSTARHLYFLRCCRGKDYFCRCSG